MKKLFYFLSLSILTSCGGSELPKDEWYVGGNLHKTSLSSWNVATKKNKLATCADYVANTKDYKGDISQMKIDAIEVMKCIDETAKSPDLSNQQTNEIALMCIILLGIQQ